ncbi:uncharacterized protein LOC144701450 [Wolffia australiana]
MWKSHEGHGRTTYFKFDKSWLREGGFKEEVKDIWRIHSEQEPGASRLATRIDGLRYHLKSYRRRIREARCKVRVEALTRIRELDEVEDGRTVMGAELQERKKWRCVVAEEDRKEEMNWRQRSQQQWLKEGDANTRDIGSGSSNGRALSFDVTAGGRNSWRWTGQGASQLTQGQRDGLVLPFDMEEVRAAMAGLNGEGALGPDGIPVFFYKEFWSEVKDDVIATLGELRNPQTNMERINKSFLFLLPKRQGAENVGDYRPISLSNSIYLIVVKTPSQPLGIPLLQYADDTLFFIEGSVEEAKNLAALLRLFANCSGLHINRGKSEFVGFGLSMEEETQCASALETPVGSLPMRYLRLPLSVDSLQQADWQLVVEKVERRLEGWKQRVLSRGGRLVLLRSKRRSRIMRRFFWKGANAGEGRVIALVSWNDICTPTKQGGLGVPDLNTLNVALLTKWVGRIVGPEGDLIKEVERDRYGSNLDWEKLMRNVRGASVLGFGEA